MNKLPLAKRVQILAMLCEGSSMRSISRVADVSINTVSKLLVDAGRACAAFHDEKVRGVKASRVQVDEIWSFTYAKQKNVATAKRPDFAYGDTWTWTAIEADSKLLVSWLVGARDGEYALAFMDDLRQRLANRVQLTSDGHRAYLQAVEEAFGDDIDYAVLQKLYGPPRQRLRSDIARLNASARNAMNYRQPRSQTRLDELCRATRSDHADADAAVYEIDERVLEEIREPRAHGCALHRVLQLDTHP